MADFERKLRDLINEHSQESASNTPDFILAQYLVGCLDTFARAIQQRETWYGRDPRPSAPKSTYIVAYLDPFANESPAMRKAAARDIVRKLDDE